MEESDYKKYLDLFKQRKIECHIQQESYSIWLSYLTPLRWVSIIIGVIFPAIVGVAIFAELFGEEWKIWSAIMLLVSGMVSGLHTALKCDSHQSECQRLKKRYEALADKYNDVIILQPKEGVIDIHKNLGNELTELKEETITTPANWCINKAKKTIANNV
mgnify:CR=1 FL=1|jgi:hypothetical protein